MSGGRHLAAVSDDGARNLMLPGLPTVHAPRDLDSFIWLCDDRPDPIMTRTIFPVNCKRCLRLLGVPGPPVVHQDQGTLV